MPTNITDLATLNQEFDNFKKRLQISEDLLSYLDLFKLVASITDEDIDPQDLQNPLNIQKLNAIYGGVAVNEGFIFNVSTSEPLIWRGIELKRGSIVIKTFQDTPVLVQSPDPATYAPEWNGNKLEWNPADFNDLPVGIESQDLTGAPGAGLYVYEYTPQSGSVIFTIDSSIFGATYFPIIKLYDASNALVFADILITKDGDEWTVGSIPSVVTKVVVR